MPSLRTPEMKQKYREYTSAHPSTEACDLCSKPALKEFTHWKIAENAFPYDLIASTHHMLIPLRHVAESGLSAEELEEFKRIKSGYVDEQYDYIIEATTKNKSIPAHHHLHLIVGKN